jgi:hypothetical protein
VSISERGNLRESLTKIHPPIFGGKIDLPHIYFVYELDLSGVKPTAVNWIIDFLRHRKQRVKLNNIVSDWLDVPAGVPQGTRLGTWLFLVLINDLKLPQESLPMWKFADDCTISEVIPPSKQSSLQQAVTVAQKGHHFNKDKWY